MVANCGATVSGTVTKKTSLVVMGGFDAATLSAGESVSSKVRRAVELRAGGQQIEVVPEATFLELVGS